MTKSHSQQILAHLKRGWRLTNLQCLEKFRCLDGRKRISELKSRGWPIETNYREVVTKSGRVTRIAVWRMDRGATCAQSN